MQNIFGGHRKLDTAPDRHVQLIYLTLPGLMLDLPHPLFANHVDLHRIFRHPILVVIYDRAAQEYGHRDNKRQKRPTRLKHHRSMNFVRCSKLFLFAIPKPKEKYGYDDRYRKSDADRDQVEIEHIHLPRKTRGLFRKNWYPRIGLHKLSVFSCQLSVVRKCK